MEGRKIDEVKYLVKNIRMQLIEVCLHDCPSSVSARESPSSELDGGSSVSSTLVRKTCERAENLLHRRTTEWNIISSTRSAAPMN